MLLVFFVLAGAVSIGVTGWYLSGPPYQGRVSDHFDGKKFYNPGHPPAKGFTSLLKWLVSRKRGGWKKEEQKTTAFTPPPKITDRLRITFVNHSTFLLQFGGINVLTDPVWAERTSPFAWVGPSRMRRPGILFEDLPHIHLVLLSHNHYDHLDIGTVRKLSERYAPVFIAPLGVKAMLAKHLVSSCIEVDWWDEEEIFPQVRVTCVPAMHFSGRGLFDRDRTLWAGFFLRTNFGNVYFAGDTGYNSKVFKMIGQRCFPVDVSLVPIGAYKPEWFMSPIHCSPAEAVQLHLDVRSHFTIASHFGTFPLADDSQLDPIEDLALALARKQNAKPFITLKEGSHFELEKP